jgi:hypothetical protein
LASSITSAVGSPLIISKPSGSLLFSADKKNHPSTVPDPIIAAAVGWRSSICITQSGKVYGWGIVTALPENPVNVPSSNDQEPNCSLDGTDPNQMNGKTPIDVGNDQPKTSDTPLVLSLQQLINNGNSNKSGNANPFMIYLTPNLLSLSLSPEQVIMMKKNQSGLGLHSTFSFSMSIFMLDRVISKELQASLTSNATNVVNGHVSTAASTLTHSIINDKARIGIRSGSLMKQKSMGEATTLKQSKSTPTWQERVRKDSASKKQQHHHQLLMKTKTTTGMPMSMDPSVLKADEVLDRFRQEVGRLSLYPQSATNMNKQKMNATNASGAVGSVRLEKQTISGKDINGLLGRSNSLSPSRRAISLSETFDATNTKTNGNQSSNKVIVDESKVNEPGALLNLFSAQQYTKIKQNRKQPSSSSTSNNNNPESPVIGYDINKTNAKIQSLLKQEKMGTNQKNANSIANNTRPVAFEVSLNKPSSQSSSASNLKLPSYSQRSDMLFLQSFLQKSSVGESNQSEFSNSSDAAAGLRLFNNKHPDDDIDLLQRRASHAMGTSLNTTNNDSQLPLSNLGRSNSMLNSIANNRSQQQPRRLSSVILKTSSVGDSNPTTNNSSNSTNADTSVFRKQMQELGYLKRLDKPRSPSPTNNYRFGEQEKK